MYLPKQCELVKCFSLCIVWQPLQYQKIKWAYVIVILNSYIFDRGKPFKTFAALLKIGLLEKVNDVLRMYAKE